MPEVMNYVEYLAQEIGPRPTGTEEEQQAALYLTEKFRSDAGLPAHIEDFTSDSESDTARTICYAATFVFVLLAMIVDILAIPALVISLLSALVVFFESQGRPILSRFFARGISQNVVAKYEPAYSQTGGSRSRKIVVLANYDSGRVQSELGGRMFGILPTLNKISFWGLIATPILLLIRYVFFLHAVGAVAIIFNILTVILLLALAIQLYFALEYKFAKYNDAANYNATGAAALIELAARVNETYAGGSRAARYDRPAPMVHGEEAAYAAGVVPAGAALAYDMDEAADQTAGYESTHSYSQAGYAGAEAELDSPVVSAEDVERHERHQRIREAASLTPMPLVESTPDNPDAGLLAAKAAIAAMTGKAVSQGVATRSLGAREQYSIYDEKPYQPTRNADTGATSAVEETPNMWAGVQGAPVYERSTDVQGTVPEATATPATTSAGVEGATAAEPIAPQAYVAPVVTEEPSVPDWYRRAQQKAKKVDYGGAVAKSRYNSALNAADEAFAAAANEASAEVTLEGDERPAAAPSQQTSMWRQAADDVAAKPQYELEERVRQLRESIMAGAPQQVMDACNQAAASEPVQGSAVEAAQTDLSLENTAEFEMPFDAQAGQEAAQTEQPAPRRAPATYEEYIAAPFPTQGEGILGQPSTQQEADLGATTAMPHVDVNLDAPEEAPRSRRIELPSLGNTGNLTPLVESQKQRAPLADVGTNSKSAAKGLLSLLPAIDPIADTSAEGEATDAAAALQATIEDSGLDAEKTEVLVDVASSTGSAGMTGTFAPVGAGLIEANEEGEDLFVEDADDSVFEEHYTETGAFAGPGYMDMPKKRGGFFSRLFGRNKKQEEEVSTAEWLDVDEDFDAREVGKARGSWESFRQDDYDDDYDDAREDAYEDDYEETNEAFDNDEWGDDWEEERWNGGAFSGLRARLGRKKDKQADEDVEGDYDEYDDYDGYDDGYDDEDDYSGYSDDGVDNFVRDEPRTSTFEAGYRNPEAAVESRELQQIFDFRGANIDTEVWFVALGSEMARQSGMKAFLREHANDLNGALFVQIDGLGAGTLGIVASEGKYRPQAAQSRMKRYAHKAAQVVGMRLPEVHLDFMDSAASYAMSQGYQAMHLLGVENGKPAHLGQADDVYENISEATLRTNINYLVELLKNI